MAKGVHQRIYGPLICGLSRQHFLAQYDGFFKLLGACKSEGFQRLDLYENRKRKAINSTMTLR